MKRLTRVFIALGVALPMVCAQAALCEVGDRAIVRWKGEKYPAVVLKVGDHGERCYIKYSNYGDEWNEWVGEDRIHIVREHDAYDGRAFETGHRLEVRWKDKWYPARVLEVHDGRYKIHYDGYESSWDEWVGPDRIRPAD